MKSPGKIKKCENILLQNYSHMKYIKMYIWGFSMPDRDKKIATKTDTVL